MIICYCISSFHHLNHTFNMMSFDRMPVRDVYQLNQKTYLSKNKDVKNKLTTTSYKA